MESKFQNCLYWLGLLREEHGTHSLSRTKASILHKATGNLRAVQILLGRTKIENTVRYPGVDVDDALALAEGTKPPQTARGVSVPSVEARPGGTE